MLNGDMEAWIRIYDAFVCLHPAFSDNGGKLSLFRNCLLSSFFICRIESIGSLEIPGRFSTLQGKQITLVDNDGVKFNFLLWGEQVLLANLFR